MNIITHVLYLNFVHLQYTKTYEEALPETGDAEIRDVLFEQLVHLTDIVLDGYRCQLESLRQCNSAHHDQFLKRYEQDRNKMIAPLCKYSLHGFLFLTLKMCLICSLIMLSFSM